MCKNFIVSLPFQNGGRFVEFLRSYGQRVISTIAIDYGQLLLLKQVLINYQYVTMPFTLGFMGYLFTMISYNKLQDFKTIFRILCKSAEP